MRESGPGLESLKPNPKQFTVETRGGRVAVSVDGEGKSFDLPLEAAWIVECFRTGLSLEEIVRKATAAGRRLPFRRLKEVLLRLVWADAFHNARDFRTRLTELDWRPTRAPTALAPFFEFGVPQDFFGFLSLAGVLCVALGAGLGGLMRAPEDLHFVSELGFLLLPAFAISLRSLLGIFALGEVGSVRLTGLGLVLTSTSISTFDTRAPDAGAVWSHSLLRFICLILALAFAYFVIGDPGVSVLGLAKFAALAILTCLVSWAPDHQSDFGLMQIDDDRAEDQSQAEAHKSHAIERVLKVVYYTGAALYVGLAVFLVVRLTPGLSVFEPGERWVRIGSLAAILGWLLFLLIDAAEVGGVDAIRNRLRKRRAKPKAPDFSSNPSAIKEELAKHPLFSKFPERTIESIAAESRYLMAPQGARIVRDGEFSTELYLVIAGRAAVYKSQNQRPPKKLMDLDPGAVFGEVGFFLGKPRSADVLIAEDAILLQIHRPPSAARLFSEQVEQEFQHRIWGLQALIASPLFSQTPMEGVSQILTQATIVNKKPGEIICTEGDISDSIYVIVRGDCVVDIRGARVRTMGSQDVFGEIGVLWNSRRTATVTAKSDIVLLRLDASDVWRILSRNLNLAIWLQDLGTERLETAR